MTTSPDDPLLVFTGPLTELEFVKSLLVLVGGVYGLWQLMGIISCFFDSPSSNRHSPDPPYVSRIQPQLDAYHTEHLRKFGHDVMGVKREIEKDRRYREGIKSGVELPSKLSA